MKPKLIIFDFDGVLVDSEIIGHRINASELTRFGFPLTVEKSIELLTGITKDIFDDIMLREYGKTVPDGDLRAMIEKIDHEIAAHVAPVPGIVQALNYLEEKNIKKCIASNGSNHYVSSILAHVNLGNYFTDSQIFSATMVNYKGKPAPDVFLLAAKHFQVLPQDCLVIEDSVLGIMAAKAANMPVIGLLHGAHTQSSWYYNQIFNVDPSMIVDSSVDLLDALKNYCE